MPGAGGARGAGAGGAVAFPAELGRSREQEGQEAPWAVERLGCSARAAPGSSGGGGSEGAASAGLRCEPRTAAAAPGSFSSLCNYRVFL